MDIRFQIAKPANIFHVVDSLSLWSGHVRKRIREHYDFFFGISEEDKKILQEYKTVRKRYGWGSLDSDFIPPEEMNQALSNARERLEPSEYESLERVIEHFYENAGKIYHIMRPRLVKRKQNLEIEIKNHDTDSMFSDLSSFYKAGCPEQVTVHLLVNTCDGSGGGGANIKPKEHVTLEPHYLGHECKAYIISDIDLVAHEISHLFEIEMVKYFENRGIDRGRARVLKEAIADTLFPGGALSAKYGLAENQAFSGSGDSAKSQYDSIEAIESLMRERLAKQIYLSTKKALENGHSVFDGDYLERAIDKLFSITP